MILKALKVKDFHSYMYVKSQFISVLFLGGGCITYVA